MSTSRWYEGFDKSGPCIIKIRSTTLERVLGLWCNQCQLSTAYRVVVATETEGDCGTFTFTGCTECASIFFGVLNGPRSSPSRERWYLSHKAGRRPHRFRIR